MKPAMQFPFRRQLGRLRRSVGASIRSTLGGSAEQREAAIHAAKAAFPLMCAAKTYNTAHPDYRPELSRNVPDRIENADRPCRNPLLLAIRKLADHDVVPRDAWQPIYSEVMAEARTVPGFDQVMERKRYIERYFAKLDRRHRAHYVAGWVTPVNAQFLYWAVRRAKPKTVVQTGVSNGFSSAFIMLALAKNGPEGRLHVIDLPAVFDPNDPAWTKPGAFHSVAIPQGKSSGWMMPDIYRDRFAVAIGDAKELLPPLVEKLDTIDMFFHDSDHTYDHMMFEFEQARRKLPANGMIVADDIAWNASLWDFADRYRMPAYNYIGNMGVAFVPASG